MQRNRDPTLHPFERAREYTKAVVATKLDKIFAKPFLFALDGHTDGVYCSSVVMNNTSAFLSGACDGEIKVWDLNQRTCMWNAIAHSGFVRGIATNVSGSAFFSCSDDKTVKQWSLLPSRNENTNSIEPLVIYNAGHAINAMHHHRSDNVFATCGECVSVWDETRNNLPTHTYKWGADSVISVSFNPAERTLLGSTGSDRGVCLYDIRSSAPMRKFLLAMNSNKLVWNPMEPTNFALANEDHNIYTFDMRNLDKALMVHKDHVGAVMDVAFSPTGKEFVSGSYDRTVRIFKVDAGRSRDMYHTKRMQRVFTVQYSLDGQYVFSGSDDTNIRCWKTIASQSLGVHAGRKERKEEYNNALKKRFSHMPEIKRITRDKPIPKVIKKQLSLRHIQNSSKRRKLDNRIRHSAEGAVVTEPERKRAVVKASV